CSQERSWRLSSPGYRSPAWATGVNKAMAAAAKMARIISSPLRLGGSFSFDPPLNMSLASLFHNLTHQLLRICLVVHLTRKVVGPIVVKGWLFVEDNDPDSH